MSRYRCLKSTVCLNNDSLCNGVKDCPLGDDERFCGFRCEFISNMLRIKKDAYKHICFPIRFNSVFFKIGVQNGITLKSDIIGQIIT